MSFTVKLILSVAGLWIVLAPPLFTDGACTAEYEAEKSLLEQDRESIKTSVAADSWYSSRGVSHAVLSVDECRRRKPRNLSTCGDGPTLIAKVPVKNLICRIYRDDETVVTLQYDLRDRLAREYVEMNPFKSLPLPWGGALHWAR